MESECSERDQRESRSQSIPKAFRTFFEISPFALILSLDGEILEANSQCLQSSGLAIEQCKGKPFWECDWWQGCSYTAQSIQDGCKMAAGGQLFKRQVVYRINDDQDQYLSLAIAPARNDRGEIEFLCVQGTDITDLWLAESDLRDREARHRFLTDLAEATQPVADPERILHVTAEMLARYLGANRCAYAEVEHESVFVITGDYTNNVPSIVGRWPVAAFGEQCQRLMLANKPYVVDDVDNDRQIHEEDLDAYRATTIQSVICVPLHKQEKFTAAMAVHCSNVREWTNAEVELVTEVVGRCWESLERARGAQAERHLQDVATAERKRLQELFQWAPSFMAVLRGPEFVFERVNDRYTSLIGGRDVVGLPLSEALPEIESQGFINTLSHVYRTGKPYVGSNVRVMLLAPGSQDELIEHNLEFVYQPLRDTAGNVTGVLAQGIDLTERNRAEQELNQVTEESNKRRRLYETALSNTPDLVYVFDLNHRFSYANEALLTMWGKSWEEAIGRNCLELEYEPWHAEMHSREIEEVRRTKKPIRGEVPFSGTYGRRIYDYIFAPVFGADGEVEAVAGTTRDVTERKAMEQTLRESDKKKDEFLAMLAHELRNPLAPIRTGLDLLRLSGIEMEILDVMQRQVEHLVRLVDDLLDVSRIMRGKIELRTQTVQISDIINRAIETTRPMFDARQQVLTTDMETQSIWLKADPIRLAQVIGNLLNNASKYTDDGGHISIRVKAGDDGVQVIVSDNGIGINPNMLSQVFDLFAQDQRNIDRSQGGLGIGLTVVKNLVEMHGGSVDAFSDGHGCGSEFSLTLPTVSGPTTESGMSNTNSCFPDLTILVVDDNRSAIFMMTRLLAKLGNHRVLAAHDGATALSMASSQRPDLVLLDIGLPNLDGLEVARRIRAMPEHNSIRLVAITGYGSEEDRRKSLSAGFDDHLVKPPSIDMLKHILSSVKPISQTI